MKVVIIEDETLMARDLAEILQQAPGQVEVTRILPSVTESVRYLKDNQSPDLIFSDIQLGDGLSFEIFGKVKPGCPVMSSPALRVA